MTELARAVDLYIGELARRNCSRATRATYERLLFKFVDCYEDRRPNEIAPDDCRAFLDSLLRGSAARGKERSASTIALDVSVLAGFFRFCEDEGWVSETPMKRIRRPRRKRPEDLEVVSVSTEDIVRMFDACVDWQEFLCLSTAVYLGARRSAISRARRGDVDLVHGTIRFLEKGRKVVVKPLPDEYLAILRAAEKECAWAGPDDYLVPNRRPGSVRRRERSDKIVWQTIKRVAARAGVRTHVHALRAAFAVQFDEAHPDSIIALKELLGHSRIDTTMVYMRRKDKARAMETVRDLSWGRSALASFAQEAHTGFEPVLPP
jgi:integrase/recombinase XerD